jgi:hypothetical protein
MRCYVCRCRLSFGQALFVAGVEDDDVAFCGACAELAFPGLSGALGGDRCVCCGVERPSMN